MPRKKLIRTNEYFYHVTTRSNHREWFKLPIHEVWEISIIAFQVAQKHCPAIVSQYVLMSNHYHMLIRTPDSNIDRFMYFFNKTFSEQLRYRSNTENRMFGGNYNWSLIKDLKYFQNVFYYIYQNPVRANIVKDCDDYKFSTRYFTSRNLEVPFKFSRLQIERENINESVFSYAKNEIIRKGLRFSHYKEAKRKM